jgi:TonB family protein
LNIGPILEKSVSRLGKWRIEILLLAYRRFGFAANRKNYNRVFHRAVLISLCLHILLLFYREKPLDDVEMANEQKEMLALRPHVFEVINARPRASLSRQMVKVPKITEVDAVQDSMPVPKIELGALDIGVGESTGGGSGAGGGGGGGGSGTALSRRPELVMLVPPVYPKDAEKNRIEGSVELRIHVTETGIVDQAEVVTSSGVQSMDEAAIKAALKTRFRSAIKNGKRVPMWINYPIQFALNKR